MGVLERQIAAGEQLLANTERLDELVPFLWGEVTACTDLLSRLHQLGILIRQDPECQPPSGIDGVYPVARYNIALDAVQHFASASRGYPVAANCWKIADHESFNNPMSRSLDADCLVAFRRGEKDSYGIFIKGIDGVFELKHEGDTKDKCVETLIQKVTARESEPPANS